MAYPQPNSLKIRRFFVKRTIMFFIRLLFKLEVNGWENVPASGAYLISHNHVSIIDPSWIGSTWPINLEIIAASELWKRPGQAYVVGIYGALPVKRGAAERDLLRKIVEVLESGTPFLIAPEGTRSHVPGLVEAQPGIGYLINQTGVPILPIGIVGTTDENLKNALKLKRPTLTMNIGKPFVIEKVAGLNRREARKQNTETVMMKICELLPKEYWGVYAEKYEAYRETQS